MITQSQIEKIRANIDNPIALNIMLSVWEDHHRLKALSKAGAVELTLTALKGDETHKVIATSFMDGVFAYHKSWGLKGMTITHVPTLRPLVRGSNKDIKNAILFMQEKVNFHEKMRVNDEKVLRLLNEEEMAIIREVHHKGRGI